MRSSKCLICLIDFVKVDDLFDSHDYSIENAPDRCFLALLLDLQADFDELIISLASDFSILVLQQLEYRRNDLIGWEIASELHCKCIEISLDVMLGSFSLNVSFHCLHDSPYYRRELLYLHSFNRNLEIKISQLLQAYP